MANEPAHRQSHHDELGEQFAAWIRHEPMPARQEVSYEQAYVELYRSIYVFLRTVVSPVKDGRYSEIIEEAARDSILRAAASYDPSRGSFKTFAFACARFRLHDLLRTESRRGWRIVPEPPSDSLIPAQEDPALQQVEEQGEIWAIFQELSPFEQEILTLRYIDGWTTEDLADLLQTSRAAARKSLSRARRKFSALWLAWQAQHDERTE